MDSHGTDRIDELPAADTPEDVAVLYSWANLHGAKYRDFSASRREYRAQLRHRAAEQVRESELKAQAEAEAAATAADAAARQAQSVASSPQSAPAEAARQQALREAGRASRIAAAERVEAARRAEAAAMAEAAARREEREIAEANASARRQAARYADSEIRNRESGVHAAYTVPGEISDPYVPHPHLQSAPLPQERAYERPALQRHQSRPVPDAVAPAPQPVVERVAEVAVPERRMEQQTVAPVAAPVVTPVVAPVLEQTPMPTVTRTASGGRRPQGYTPDDASGVRQIYRGPDFDEPSGEYVAVQQVPPSGSTRSQITNPPPRRAANIEPVSATVPGPLMAAEPQAQAGWPFSSGEQFDAEFDSRRRREGVAGVSAPAPSVPTARTPEPARVAAPPVVQRVAPSYAQPVAGEPNRGRRAQDDMGYRPPPDYSEANRKVAPPPPPSKGITSSTQQKAYVADPSGPAWLYAQQTPAPAAPVRPATPAGVAASPFSSSSPSVPQQSSVADTLQHSRERVAARWFALKGVFEQPGQEQQEAPVRQKETRTPVLAVFSLAGGVGKTSLVATLGRSLSSMGEKVLLTDTTSHGLLPFYFGASELRQGVVRTFSPPSGSTDAPIYLVSYDVEQGSNEEAQEHLVEEIKSNSKGTHRILLDLTPGSGWVARRMAKMNPTVLVPVAPDMNSVISLQAVEKYFHGTVDSDGRPLQPYYVINQFDASLPLHLDVREVLRRQLGERLLPFVIRRAPSVSEALAEGMTVVDYAPETPVAEDYQNVAAWLRTIAAPATAGFRNVRWSER
jgi:cellulose synthase operon protein YhjQ